MAGFRPIPFGGWVFVFGEGVAVRVYIDGFNLYYGACRHTPNAKWLNVVELARRLLPDEQIDRVRYYTARVKPPPWDPSVGTRQDFYLRALSTLPEVDIIHGRYQHGTKSARLAEPPHDSVKVLHVEEKGSDVNLGAHLVYDAMRGLFSKAVVISNDSDLAEPVRLVVSELHKRVVVVNPRDQRSARELEAHASECRKIRAAVVQASQFPDALTDGRGTFHKPPGW